MTNPYRLATGAALLAFLVIVSPAAAEVKPGSKVSSPVPTAGSVFRDRLKNGSSGPEMVVIPAGRFRMGAIFGGGDPDEKPVHWVSIARPFAMGKYEVTFEEYDRFCDATGREKPKDGRRWFGPLSREWGRGRMPVMNVSWEDAAAYAKWLSEQTGQKYRLPSEAEWEFAARGGKDTPFWWGGTAGEKRANCKGCGSKWDNKKGAPAGSFAANPYGLFDTAGNVWEWCLDTWHDSYTGAPADGSPWLGGDDTRRVQRGGSFGSKPRYIRSSARGRGAPDGQYVYLGFRVLREL
ncbi:formylglycine-generating enzyme family protein [Geobacter hydrogenophilus]|uniref:Protein 3-oxoalanine-generating enzyme family protein n=1 Tax=Geobacter hydrogenophilus TaxID=40983 RepID=A0A9W6G3W6_9BACT|nr:formylglycine-generating enzyme family protein [Geobacter hydrogenophilus]MBT0892643.1 formylglycine-generating enzyme family protein [Geobacter hydrogenophilus]GLI40041.1 protein 3-oxoalanine-generating enzyme family protein [Geobacter hydrogenophilus]